MTGESRPLDFEERMWAHVFGATLTCDTKGCDKEAAHSHEEVIAPGARKEKFLCAECAAGSEEER